MDTPLIVELIPDPELGGFTARIPDIPAYGEGETTEDEAIVDLKEALRAYIEAFGIDDALARANVPLTGRPLDWTLQDLTPPWLDDLAQAADTWCASWNRKALRWFGYAGSTSCCRTASGSVLPPATRLAICSIPSRDNRLSVICVR